MSTNKSVVNSYCVFSALFFAACAWAQLNDPDPILWILGYTFGGCLFNFLVMMYQGEDKLDEDVRTMCRWLMSLFAIGNAAVILYMCASLIPKIDVGLAPKELAWSVLEFEEGREIAGLAILLMHVNKLRGYLAEVPSSTSDKNEKTKATSGYRAYVGTIVMFGAIAGAVYLWVYYQPDMNTKYRQEHCDGAFGENRAEL